MIKLHILSIYIRKSTQASTFHKEKTYMKAAQNK